MAEGGNISNLPALETDKVILDSNIAADSMDPLDILLERTRSERQNELQQIQHDNRPVTGQNHRDNINHFLAKNIEVRDHVTEAHASGKENVPMNSINVEEHRPEAVVVEIQGLTQQQRVSSVLQTAAFRRHLEGIIRGSISSVTQSRSPSSSHRPSPSPASRQSPSVETRPPSVDTRPTPPPAREQVSIAEPSVAVNPIRRDSVSSSSTSSSNISVDYNTRIQDPQGLLRAVLNNNLPDTPATADQSLPQPVTWNLVSERQEDLVQEVSELVHRRLVTSTLEGEFRNVLEFHVRERVQATGTDGQRVEEFVRSIPQSQQHIPNDYSNLGLPAPMDNWDNMSVTSISATAVPYTQTNLHMSREIASLKSQLQEMKNMMKVSFDLQLDIQRSIRQEVAAGIAAAAGGSFDPAKVHETSTAAKSKPINDTHCLICLDNHSDSVLYQCGHMCVCYPCGRHLMDRGAKCPVCRAPIRDIIKAYKCNQD